ncbi:hypothetical protein RVR_501 [Actinacidiphila reveromycinica]|uniref:TldD/PmbA family protein n=1 Tax=Actinacidiphila reveromycinica TaxID=659352 RepID=A0A7U3UN21_9ACTN|nr:metallopeptidase TldD-related protein [Streptomyces sp. SN-593]BBA95587.1 hypothetical protein RVR_501 [Streptomyces sp. SN-593]
MRDPGTVDPAPLQDALPGERLELVTRTALRRRVRMTDGAVDSVGDATTTTTMVRSVADGSVGCATTSGLSATAVAEAVRVARRLRAPGVLAPADDRTPPARDPAAERAAQQAWERVVSCGTAESIARLRELSARVHGVRRAQATWDQVAQFVTLADSAGRVVSYRHPEVTLALTVVAAGRTGRSTGTGGRTAAGPDGLDAAGIAAEAVAEAAGRMPSATRPEGAPPRRLDAVIAPRAASRLLAQIAAVFYGDRADLDRAGAYAPGSRVLADGVGLVDDAGAPSGLGTVPCDDEGTLTARTVLVDDGRAGALLHDRSSPSPGSRSSGNGWMVPFGSGVGSGIAVAGTLLALRGPVRPLTDLLGGSGPVLYVTRIDDGSGRALDAAHDSVRMALSGWLVRDGAPYLPVAGVSVGMRLRDFLARIEGTSDVREDYRVAAGSTLRKGPAVHSTHISLRDLPVTFQEDSWQRQ